MKVALVYDRINKWGGAERVLLALHEIWPTAPLYTSVYEPSVASWAKQFLIKTSFLNVIPWLRTKHEWLSLLMPIAFGNFRFDQYDVVISVTSAEAKYVRVPRSAVHLCYCLTPTRYLWSHSFGYQQAKLKGKVLKWLGPLLRMQDVEAASKVDSFAAISATVEKRIQKYYRRCSQLIYPPVSIDAEKMIDATPPPMGKDYFLVVSRLVAYKRIDLAIIACNYLQVPLVIIGSGSELPYLQSIAGSTIYFKGHLTDRELYQYYKHCRALIFPGEEDFGITPVEAQWFGKPVVCYEKGGASETVRHKKTGILFSQANVQSLIQAIELLEKTAISSDACHKNALRFTKKQFKVKMQAFVESLWQQKMTIS